MKDKFRFSMEFGIAFITLLFLLGLLYLAYVGMKKLPPVPAYNVVQVEGMTCIVMSGQGGRAITCNWDDWEGR